MNIERITTTYDGTEAITVRESTKSTADLGVEAHAVNLYPQMKYQSFQGFGGALTEAAGYAFSLMNQIKRDEILNAYFGENGNGYRMARMQIDSCDFSLGNYSAMDDPTDTELKSFSLHRDEQYILPLLEAAQQTAGVPIEIMLTPWSPPPFMKTNGQKNGGGSLKPEYRAFWARYICRYIQEYRSRGFLVNYLTIQNEPKAAQKWDSCVFTAQEEKEFVRDYLYPALLEHGIENVEICIWDHNKERVFERACDIIDDTTDEMVGGVAFHWYSGDHFEAVSLVREKFPDKTLIFSEGCVEYSRFSGDGQLQNAQMYAHDIIGNLNAGMNAFLDWNILLDEKGGPNHVGNYCDAPILCDGVHQTVEKRLSYTYIGHFSRYIRQGAKRIAISRYSEQVEVTALENPDGSITVILLNREEHILPIVLRISGQICEFALPASSICTVLLTD